MMVWPELHDVSPILAALLQAWPLEWISLCTTLDPKVDAGMFVQRRITEADR